MSLLRTCLLCAAVLTVSALPAAASVIVGAGTSTYSYDTGTDVADIHAVLVNTTFTVEAANVGNSAYYSVADQSVSDTGTVTYTFTAPVGYKFSGNATETDHNLLAVNPDGTLTHQYSTDAGLSFTTIATDGPPGTTDFSYYDTAHSFNVNGAVSFLLQFVLYDPGANSIFTQFSRDTNGATDFPFTVTTTTVPLTTPEPAAFGLLAIGAAGLLLVRRRTRA